MAITQRPDAVPPVFVVTTNATTQDTTVTLGSGTKRTIVVFVTREGTPTASSVTFDPTGTNEVFTQRLDFVHGTVGTISIRAFVYEVADGVPSGAYTVRTTFSSSSVANVSTIYPWVLDNAARGVPELATGDDGVAADANVTLTGTVTVNAHVMAVALNASAAATWTWSGGAVTEIYEGNETANTTSAADGIASGTSVTVTAADGATSNKVLAVLSIAVDNGGGGGGFLRTYTMG